MLDSSTLHQMFPNLHVLVDFQKRFLSNMEEVAALPWTQQRWGMLFSDNVSTMKKARALPDTISKEEGFSVYEQYCGNYSAATAIVKRETQTLLVAYSLHHPVKKDTSTTDISPAELPAFIVKPVSRVCKYPLLLHVSS